MAYTRREAREKLAQLLAEHEYQPGKRTLTKVWDAQVKEVEGLTPIAMVWNGPLWFDQKRAGDAPIHSVGLRVALMVARTDEQKSEDWLDRSTEALLEIIRANISLDGYWTYIEFAGETYLDFPPVESGEQYRREIFDLRAYMNVTL